MKKLVMLAILAFALFLPAQAGAESPTDSYLIEAKGQIPDDLADRVTAAGGTLLRVHPEIRIALAQSTDPGFAANLSADTAIKSVDQDMMVAWAPYLPAEGSVVESPTGQAPAVDPTTAFYYPCQWNLHNIDAPTAWALGVFGDPGVKVAVLDSGVDPFHQDLAGRIDTTQSVSVLSPGSSPCGPADEQLFNDFRYHGTFVASQITSNGLGIAGVAPDTEVVGVKVLNCGGSGSFGDVIAGIVYAANLGDVDVINMSLGAVFPKSATGAGPLVAALNKAVNYAVSQGKLVVSAAGNDGLDMTHTGNLAFTPAESGSGIGVYATAWDDNLASYSNYGISGTWVGAPGGDGPDPTPPLPGCAVSPSSQGLVLGACSTTSIFFNCGAGTSYLIGGGTSFASPIVAGVAALVDGQSGGSLNSGQLKTILKNTADDLGAPGADNLYAHGRVNAGRAVQ